MTAHAEHSTWTVKAVLNALTTQVDLCTGNLTGYPTYQDLKRRKWSQWAYNAPMQRRTQRGKVDVAVEAAVEAVTGNVLAASRLKRLMKALTPEQRLAVLKNVAERIAALEREVRAAISRIDVRQ